jgi:hypothetical protein
MHRIDTPTAQEDKFGAGKNGFTNGDPGTGRRATDLNSDMWDAVQEEICNVIEKSGLALNKEQHDQLYQAIGKIISSKIPDALIRNKNLSDLVDKAVARSNLGLGTAATASVQTSKDDVTTGRVLVNGGALALRSVRASQTAGADVVSANDLPINAVSFTYSDALNGPGITASLISFSGLSGNYPIQFSAAYSGGGNRALFRTYNGDAAKTWNPWFEFYHTGNKPTPAEVGAVAKAGDTMTGVLTVPGVNVKQKTANTAFVIYFALAEGGNLGYIGQGTTTKDIYISNYAGANNFALKADGGVEIRGNSTTANISVIGNLNPTSFATFDVRYQAKGSYTPAGQAYTKSESDARYGVVNGIRRGGQQHKVGGNWIGAWEAPAGCVMTGLNTNEGDDGRKMGIYYRQLQYLNKQTGAWVNIGD